MPIGKPSLLFLLIYAHFAVAQQIDVAGSWNQQAGVKSLFDQIQAADERNAFRQVWNIPDAAKQKEQALAFAQKYPRSVLLKETYELVARASVALGDDAEGLAWAKRSLRLLPENPFLLAMAANLAAKLGQYDWAADRARWALDYLDRAAAPPTLSPSEWASSRNSSRGTAFFALARAASSSGRSREAERWLLEALRINAKDYDALYALGAVRAGGNDAAGAAACFAEAMHARGAIGTMARTALQRIYSQLPNARMSFTEFAASQKWHPPAPASPQPGRTSGDRYAGSAACRECHAAEYENWRQTGMAKMFRPDSTGDAIGDFSGRQAVSGSARAVQQGERRFLELREQESGKWVRYAVDFLIGSKWQQAYASKLPNGDILVLPIQYSRILGAWVNYWSAVDGVSARSDLGHFRGTPDGALYQRDCAPCHTSQLRYPAAGAASSAATFREGGVDCEMCHGPSLAHVESARAGAKPSSGAAVRPPVDFGHLAPEESVAICAQCHMQSAIHEPDPNGAVNFTQDAAPFYRTYRVHLLSEFTRKAFYADGRFRATTFIGEAFMRSRCFRDGGATCVSCHNPHPDGAASNPKSLRFPEDSDEMCTQCHASLRANPAPHTRHAPGTAASRCVSCHMPRNMDALLFRARSHQIDEIPDAEMTARFGAAESPNACLECHRDRSLDWLDQQLSRWRSK